VHGVDDSQPPLDAGREPVLPNASEEPNMAKLDYQPRLVTLGMLACCLSLSAVLQAARAEDPAKRNAAAGSEPAPPAYDMAEIRDSDSLELEVVSEWQLVPGDPPTRQKAVTIKACTWWPGRDVRLPVVMVAPAEGGPFPFIIASTGLGGGRVRPDDLARALLPRGVAFVHVGIGAIEQMEPAGVLADEMNDRFLKTRDVRYTATWIWGLTYMRAVTAALTEDKVFKTGKIGAIGGSKRGLASAAAGVWDDRVTVIVPMVAPVFGQPQYNKSYPELDEAFLRLAEQGKTELAVGEAARLRTILKTKSRYWLDDEDFLAAGWTPSDIEASARQVGALHLAVDNLPRWDRRGLDYFFQLGTNDNVTPHLVEMFEKYPRFSSYVVPGGQHGTDGVGNQRRTPTLAEVKANSLAVFSNHFFGDRPRMQNPRIEYKLFPGRVHVEVTFDQGSPAETGTLYWSSDRPPEGSLPYEHSPWESAPMKATGARTWTGEIPLAAKTSTLELLSVHSDTVNEMPMYVSSGLRRLTID
jgi:hypothetical protein